jgi:hypothetical protein
MRRIEKQRKRHHPFDRHELEQNRIQKKLRVMEKIAQRTISKNCNQSSRAQRKAVAIKPEPSKLQLRRLISKSHCLAV